MYQERREGLALCPLELVICLHQDICGEKDIPTLLRSFCCCCCCCCYCFTLSSYHLSLIDKLPLDFKEECTYYQCKVEDMFFELSDAEGRYVERTQSHADSLSLICMLFSYSTAPRLSTYVCVGVWNKNRKLCSCMLWLALFPGLPCFLFFGFGRFRVLY